MRALAVTLIMMAVMTAPGCNPGFGQTSGTSPFQPQAPGIQSTAVASPASTLNSGIYGTIRGGGGAAPGTSFNPAGSCVSILDSAGALVATADCNAKGEFKVALPAGTYTVRGAGQTLQVRVREGSWSTAYFRINMR